MRKNIKPAGFPGSSMPSSRQRKRQIAETHANGSVEDKRWKHVDSVDTTREYGYPSSNLVSLLTHLAMVLFYAGVNVWGALVMMSLAKTGQVKYSLKYSPLRVVMFVTMQNLYIQTGYFALALTADLLPISKVKAQLKALCSYLFTTVAFPLSMIVAVGYWSILAVDASYLYTDETASVLKLLPPLLNHCWHTAVAIGVLLELLLVFHHYPSHTVATTTILLYNLAYCIEVFTVYYCVDLLPYPFLRILGPGGMAVFFLLMFPVLLAFYYTGRTLSYLRWSKDL